MLFGLRARTTNTQFPNHTLRKEWSREPELDAYSEVVDDPQLFDVLVDFLRDYADKTQVSDDGATKELGDVPRVQVRHHSLAGRAWTRALIAHLRRSEESKRTEQDIISRRAAAPRKKPMDQVCQDGDSTPRKRSKPYERETDERMECCIC